MGALGSPSDVNTVLIVQFFTSALCHALWILPPSPQLLAGRNVICYTVTLVDVINAGAGFIAAESHVLVDRDLVKVRSLGEDHACFLVSSNCRRKRMWGLKINPSERFFPAIYLTLPDYP